MSRISNIPVSEAPAASVPLLDAVHQQLGVVPNLMRVVSHSPAALEGYLSLNGALAKGVLDVQVRERLALVVAQANGCDYCLSAHTYLASNFAKLDASEVAAARRGAAADMKAHAALVFAQKVLASKGKVQDEDLTAVKAAGHDDAAVVEIVVNVALNVLTNFVNNVAKTDIDFPVVHAS